jgi:L-ascorbate metabolism protein UlaG (beta-lactamase superfamily)
LTGEAREGAPRHPDGRGFANAHPVTAAPRPRGGFLHWQRSRRPAPWPAWIEDPPQPPPPHLPAERIGATFIGHSSFLIQIGGLRLLVDPIWSMRCSPVPFAGPKRVRAPGQRLEDLPGVDALLLSHNHYDHMDMPTLRRVRARFAPRRCVTGLGNAAYLARAGLGDATELDWWRSTTIGEVTITYVPARHFSARGLHDRSRALWGGCVLQRPDGAAVYFAGDSGWCPHFAEIGARFPDIRLALLPIGAYAPRWFMAPVHIDPEEAVRAHLALGARRSLGMHHGTFARLTDEAIDEPPRLLAEARARHGLAEEAFGLLPFGGTLVL